MTKHKYALAWTLLVSMTACSSDDASPIDAEDPDLDACEHLEGGPFADLTAADDAAQAPSASESHVAYRLTLLDDGLENYGGIVTLPANAAGRRVLYLDQPVPLSMEDAGGTVLPLESGPECPGSSCSSSCSLVQNRVVADIDLVGTYVLRFGPGDQPEVTLVHFDLQDEHSQDP